MAVALSDADVSRLGPSARRQLGATPEPQPPKAAASAPKAQPVARDSTPATGGASPRTREAARATGRAWRASGSGRPATAGRVSVRGVIWLFVWIGVLLYLVSNPATLPRFVHLVFAPVNGLIAVARGASAVAGKSG